jgi:hypothetical protein
MTSLESRLKELLYLDSGAAETDYPAPVTKPPPMPELTADQCVGMDDTAGFFDAVKAEMHQQFSAHGWSNTAAAELAEIHCGVEA